MTQADASDTLQPLSTPSPSPLSSILLSGGMLLGTLLLAAEAQDGMDSAPPPGGAELESVPAEPSDPEPWFPESVSGVTLTLDDFRRQLFAHNEQIQIQLLGVLVAEQTYQAARGAFEPTLVSEVEYIDSLRPNNAEQTASQSGLGIFDEQNALFSNGIETLLPTAGRVRLGFNVHNLRNNLQRQNPDRTTPEYNTFFGFNLTQPLLKGAGRTASMASLRLAARESQMSFQDYRRELMATVAAAEAAYWTLFVASQEVAFAEESVELARSIHADVKKAVEAGRSTEAEVMASRVAILERESTLALAKQQRFEAGSAVLSYFSSRPVRDDAQLPRTSSPADPSGGSGLDSDQLCDRAFDSNPDYLRRATQVELEGVRVAYAENQNRPTLDLKASYGLNGLGDSFGTGIDDLERGEFPAWSVGLEMRIPLGGNIAGDANLTAAEARKAQALLGLKEVEIQLNVAMENAIRGMATAKESFRASQGAVDLRAAILADERERLDAGRSNIRTLFEVEEEYERSKAAALRALLGVQTAALQIELVTGTILANRDWETTPEELKQRTQKALDDALAESRPDQPKKTEPKREPTTASNTDRKAVSEAGASDGGSELREFRPWRDYKQRAEAERAQRAADGEPEKPRRRGIFNRLREEP